MKIACFTPIKTRSTRVEKKNFMKIGGTPLYKFTFDTIRKVNTIVKKKDIVYQDYDIDFFVDTDSLEIKKAANDNRIGIIERDPELSKDTANGNDLLAHHIERLPDYDIYCQLYITCPFQKATSIVTCLDDMIAMDYDSAFLGHENKTWFWYDGKPLNYKPGVLPRSQDSVPVINETTGFYAIRKETWEQTQCRIGQDPYIHLVPFVESIDIDDIDDMELAKAVYYYAEL